jgi:HD-like signal output (HDOD) protein
VPALLAHHADARTNTGMSIQRRSFTRVMHRPTHEQFLAALTKTERLSAAPRVLGSVLQLLRSTDSALHAISDLINCDPALAADVLRCANSAYYSRGARVAAITEAIQVIGFHETIRIVSLVVIRQTTHRDLGSYGIAAEDFWAESLFSGLCLEALVQRTGAGDPGAAYTAGLLRFIGRLAIDQTIADLGGGLFWDGEEPLADWERREVGLTQSAAGALLLDRWQFPAVVANAVGAQDAAPADWSTLADPLAAALHALALILPAGQTLSGLESPDLMLVPLPAEHPYAIAHAISDEMLAEIRASAQAAFVKVRRDLYPD